MSYANPLDPKRFDAQSASPELRAIAQQIAASAPTGDLAAGPPLEVAKAARAFLDSPENIWNPAGGRPLCERAETREIAGPAGPLPLRIIRPADDAVRGVMLHLHGGGWFVGHAAMSDWANEAMADALGVAVVSVEYRLAPEAPYPAAPDDCEAAAIWLVDNALRELGSDALLVGGESAGGHLAANVLLRMRDRNGYTGFRAANLVYGVYDLAGSPSRRGDSFISDMFLPEGQDRRDPDVSPLYADLSGLPPALFSVGSLDSLLDDTLFMYARYVAAGNEAELEVCPGAPHGYDSFRVPEAKRARERMHAFLGARI
jgi:acetyl esterase/lipase